MKPLIEIFKLIRAYRWTLPILVLLGVVASIAEGFGVGLLIPFAQEVFGRNGGNGPQNTFLRLLFGFADTLGEQNRTAMLALAIVGFILFKSAVMFVYMAMSEWVKGHIAHHVRSAMFQTLVGMDYGKFNERSAGDYYNVIAGETWRATEALKAFFVLLSQLATASVFLVLLIALSWKLLALSGLVFVGASLLVRVISRKAEDFSKDGVEANTRMAERLLSTLTGMRTMRAFAQEKRELRELDHESGRLHNAFLRMDIAGAVVGPMLEAIYLPFFVGLVYFSGHLGLEMPTLIAFVVLTYRLIPHARSIEQERVVLSATAQAVAEVVRLLPPYKAPQGKQKTVLQTFNHSLIFEKVSFGYGKSDREERTLKEISFALPYGKTVAIVGTTGSGKSTIVSLLLGLYRPNDGKIWVDGVELNDIDLPSWRRHIGFAGQDCHLFPGSIADNISYGRPDATRAQIEDAARRSNVTEFLPRLPDGLDTMISREGLDLSGGQRQRIALARALLIDPDILVFDEATNAVDNITEATLQKTLVELSSSKTMLIIAHRLSTIRHADWVIALDNGRIAEQGPPSELLKRNAAFAKLYRIEADGIFDKSARSESSGS